MKTLTRDILLTLVVKSVLLITLWWICFKDVEKPAQTMQQWLVGDSIHANKLSPRGKP